MFCIRCLSSSKTRGRKVSITIQKVIFVWSTVVLLFVCCWGLGFFMFMLSGIVTFGLSINFFLASQSLSPSELSCFTIIVFLLPAAWISMSVHCSSFCMSLLILTAIIWNLLNLSIWIPKVSNSASRPLFSILPVFRTPFLNRRIWFYKWRSTFAVKRFIWLRPLNEWHLIHTSGFADFSFEAHGSRFIFIKSKIYSSVQAAWFCH